MGKFLLRSFLFILIVIISSILYISYFGLETKRFDNLIKNKANDINQHIKLEFNKTKIHLNLMELNLTVKLQNPIVLVKKNEIKLSKLDLFLALKSFFSDDFLLKRAEVAFVKNDIKDLTKVTNLFLPKIFNKRLNKIFKEGNLQGEFLIPFNSDGSIGKEYIFSGTVSDASINLSKEFIIRDLTTEIQHNKTTEGDAFNLNIKKGLIYDVQLQGTTINLKREENKTKISSSIHTDGKLNYPQVKTVLSLFNIRKNNFKEINTDVNLKTNINFDLNKKFRFKNFSYSSKGKIRYLEIHTEKKVVIEKYLPDYDPKIIIKDTEINFTNSKVKQNLAAKGSLKIQDKFDNFKIKQIYNYNKKTFNINGFVNLTNSKVSISRLNYNKNEGKQSKLSFDINFILYKYYNIKNLNFLADKTKINFSNIKLNKKFEINDLEKIEIITFQEEFKNNDFLVNKSKKTIISGKVFDAKTLLKSLYKKDDKKTFSKKFNSKIKINFDKTLTGTNDDITNFSMIGVINAGSFDKLNLKGNFSKDEIVEMSIYKIENGKKLLQIISDRARPFIKNFDFIKGFEGGKLEYESIISDNESNSDLIITDFKVSKVPALAQLLSLASLQGIADTLSGEGIRFESFEMKSNSKENLLNIEEALAMGPSISILLEGYVDKGKTVSLRGTLVPATKLNSIIASIPIVGDILVGKKTGEGVVGVSFKMKGPPKDIKTTVNPIKTLTPRFIVRAVERIKKRKKEEVK